MKKASDILLRKEIKYILYGSIRRIKQDEKESSTNFRINSDYLKIDFYNMSDLEIYNLIRAQVYPLQGAYIEINKKRIFFNKLIPIEKIKKLRVKYAN